jgi:hypothetical protein
MDSTKREKGAGKQPLSEQGQGLFEAVDRSRSKFLEALTQVHRDKQARIGRAWSEYTTETSHICSKAFKVWIDSYNSYLGAFAKLPAQPDDAALQSVRSAWTQHIEACQQSPETAKTMIDAERKLIKGLGEAEKTCVDAEQSAIATYSESVDSALSAHGLSRLDAVQAQFVVSEIVARSVSPDFQTVSLSDRT